MVYNSNTSLRDQAPKGSRNRAALVSQANTERDRQEHSDAFDPLGSPGWKRTRTRTMKTTMNNTLDPYREYMLRERPGGSVTYGPLESPEQLERGYGLGGIQKVMMDKYQEQPGYVKFSGDPLDRVISTSGMGQLGGEVSLIGIQQTMMELKNRAEIEITANKNRYTHPADRITRFSLPETIMEKLIPGIANNARTEIVKSTMMSGRLLENPWKESSEVGVFFNIMTGSWERSGSKNLEDSGPPELMEDFEQENMLWKQNMYHGPDYKEGGNTKDTTGETIKTVKNTGELVTTNISDSNLTKNKEFDRAETEAGKKEGALKTKMDERKKQSGLSLGMNLNKSGVKGGIPPKVTGGTFNELKNWRI
jgi:hypothetical protein